ncbi:MAG: hypothetical protein HZB50_08910 [Chloroflexi bacterium]|nr:hypothetical protein [Chloroflexota bacterium]
MFFMWIVPLLLIGLAVYAISGNNLVKTLSPITVRTCSQCGQAAQTDWKNCPHCGRML